MKKKMIGVDLFAGAGGMSLGAQMAGVDTKLAIEYDEHAAATYKHNHPHTKVLTKDITEVQEIDIPKNGCETVLFGGPPCQGFSTSNQRTRTSENKNNWMFQEFMRLVRSWEPDWVVFENVKGIVETEGGIFKDQVLQALIDAGYTPNSGVLSATDFGVPQRRQRFFVIASRHGIKIKMPKRTRRTNISVADAIFDLPKLENGANTDYALYSTESHSPYSKKMRTRNGGCLNHLVTRNSETVLKRYACIPQGGNWENIPDKLMGNYADKSRCHTGIYRRLRDDEPSVVIGNYRKNMLIHPIENRGLSVREAARIQSFPDSYVFKGSIGFQQQQVGNAVPPFLARAVFRAILKYSPSNSL
ncbi:MULTISPECIES: DNA cytosine methyltransferase [unclassified Lentimonas]|uniref:DNA cytosine methyltransferase n=1 Tax=unclassified Lentimonas TaxID=2630993 RepID=UPI001321E0F8|nr:MULTISPECIES: DNA cytosine methyltransferase [unclassified Lentimonas]CAA6692641.1 Unannotated [Lentimonas sp. CC19]CAA6696982.1 Unannotated [Lentimonas sp. CC10]CAA7071006.1 Unannotated [Lentimonas sp. CC11]